MELGFYSPEIKAGTLEEQFAKARQWGFTTMQYNFLSSHGEELPPDVTPEDMARIRAACAANGLTIAAINGTFNMIERKQEQLEECLRRFSLVAWAARELGCPMLTLCTGSRSPQGMWTYHPDSASQEAWDALIRTTERLLPIAERYNLTLGLEVEASNVVCTIERAQRYLAQVDSPLLQIILDCANLFPAGTARAENVRPTIAHAFDALGQRVALAHGKDVLPGDKVAFTSPGRGIVDYAFFFARLQAIGYSGPLILHGLHAMEDFEPSVAYILKQMALAQMLA